MRKRRSWIRKNLRERGRLNGTACAAVVTDALAATSERYENDDHARMRALAAAATTRGYYRTAEAILGILATAPSPEERRSRF